MNGAANRKIIAWLVAALGVGLILIIGHFPANRPEKQGDSQKQKEMETAPANDNHFIQNRQSTEETPEKNSRPRNAFDINSVFENGYKRNPEPTGLNLKIFNSPTAQTNTDQSATASTEYFSSQKNAGANPSQSENAVLKAYGNQIGLPIKTFASRAPEIAGVFEAITKNPDKDGFEKLKNLAGVYKDLAVEIKKTEPPAEIAPLSKKLIDDYQAVGSEIWEMASRGEPDLKISGDSWKNYTGTVIRLAKDYLAIMKFFQTRGVIFAGAENGSVFSLY